jgi:hypothetical protein
MQGLVFTPRSRFILRAAEVCALLVLSATPSWSRDVFRLWHGVGIQGTQSQWSIEVDLRKPTPTVRYPGLKCSGEWQKLQTSDGRLEYREVIKIARETCIDGFVRVYLVSNTRLAIDYSESKGGPLIAQAVVFPGKHHARRQQHMIAVTRQLIAEKGNRNVTRLISAVSLPAHSAPHQHNRTPARTRSSRVTGTTMAASKPSKTSTSPSIPTPPALMC